MDSAGEFVAAVLGFLALLVGMGIGGCVQNDIMQTRAVQHGAAYWETASDGSTTFKWKGEGENGR